MRVSFAALSLVALCLVPTGSLRAQEIALTFEDAEDLGGYVPRGSTVVALELACPEGDWTLPELVVEQSHYGLLPLGDSEFLFVVHSRTQGGQRRDRVFFDRNGNGDLTDDPVLTGKAGSFGRSYRTTEFPQPIELEFELDGETRPYLLGLELSLVGVRDPSSEGPGDPEVRTHLVAEFESRCCYVGDLELDGRKLHLRLFDEQCDGRFDQRAHSPRGHPIGDGRLVVEGDRLYLSDDRKISYYEGFALGDHLVVGEHLYALELDLAIPALRLAERTEGLFPLELPYPTERLALHTADFEHSLLMIEPGASIALPADRYRLAQYELEHAGDLEDVWLLRAVGTEDSPWVEVGPSLEARYGFGEPLVVGARVSEWSLERYEKGEEDELDLDFYVRGAAAEVVTNIDRIRGRKSSIEMSTDDKSRPVEPTFAIVETGGKRALQGSFEYG